jgi:hypothetical protein
VSLTKAIKGLIVVVAVMFGASSNAFAHAGHADAQPPASAIVASPAWVKVTPQSVVEISGVVARPSSIQSDEPVSSGPCIQTAAFHSGVAVCPPGACCCQGASSCGMGGHCCTSLMHDHANWTSDLSDHMRYHLARLGWVYPDIVIGLDRPPKA